MRRKEEVGKLIITAKELMKTDGLDEAAEKLGAVLNDNRNGSRNQRTEIIQLLQEIADKRNEKKKAKDQKRKEESANQFFADGVYLMKEMAFEAAAEKFGLAKTKRNEIGDKDGAMAAEAHLAENLSRMYFKQGIDLSAIEHATYALKFFKKFGDSEGIDRVSKLAREIEQKNN